MHFYDWYEEPNFVSNKIINHDSIKSNRIAFRKFKTKSCSMKKRFKDPKEAHHFLKRLNKKLDNVNEMRVYYCEFCHGYHTTKVISE